MVICSKPECQTTAGCKCQSFTANPAFGDHVFVQMPATYTLEQPTMGLRWRGGVLEQAFLINSREIVWRAVPTVA